LVIAHTAAKHRQGFLLGLKQGAIPLSTLAAGLAVPAVALTVGWRWAFVAGGVLAFGAVALVPGSESIVRAPRPSVAGTGHVLDAPMSALILLTVGLATAAFATGSLGAFVVQSGVDAGLAEGTAGYVLAVGSAGAFIVYLLAGSYADVRRGLELKMTAAMLAVGAVCLAVLALGVPAAFLAAGPIAFTIGWGWPGLFNIAVMRSSPSAPGAATGITQTGAYVGVVLGPPAFGLLAEHWSYTVAWSAAAVCSLLSALVVLAGHRRLHRDAQIATQPPSTAIT
jgi:predicted MFS family arabinose efflux permease